MLFSKNADSSVAYGCQGYSCFPDAAFEDEEGVQIDRWNLRALVQELGLLDHLS